MRPHDPSAAVEALLTRGEARFAAGDLKAAEQHFRAALGAAPTHTRALNDLAVVLHATDRLAEAETTLLKAAVFDSMDPSPLVNLASMAHAAGRLAEARGYVALAREGRCGAPDLEQLAALEQAMPPPLHARVRAKASRTGFRASFAEVDISPLADGDAQLVMQGLFTAAPRMATHHAGPLKMQLLLIEDQGGARALLVSADIFGFDAAMVAAVRAAAAGFGLAQDAVLLNASHTHYGVATFAGAVPGLGVKDCGYATAVTDAIGGALPTLVDALAPAGLSWARAHAQIGFNRRGRSGDKVVMTPNLQAHYETETPLLVVHRGDGELCVLLNHGCHPTGLAKSTGLSPDFVGAARDAIADQLGAGVTVMFLQGAAGNIKHGWLERDVPRWSATPQTTERAGRGLAEAVCQALAGELSPVSGPIQTRQVRYAAPLKPRGDLAAVLAHPANRHVSASMLAEWASGVRVTFGERAPGELSSTVYGLSIGDLALCGFAGEPVAELAASIRARSGRAGVVFVLGYTNGIDAYLPTDLMVEEGGYESYRSHFVYLMPSAFAVGVERAVLDAAARSLAVLDPRGESQ
jgi:neutral ceramidase